MKCLKHTDADAVAVCTYCGRALCQDCLPDAAAPRVTCSPACAASLAKTEEAIQAILQQSSRNARASAFYCYVCGGLSAAAAVAAWFILPSPFLIMFTAGCAVVLILSGMWYGQAAPGREKLQQNQPGSTRGGGAFTNVVARR